MPTLARISAITGSEPAGNAGGADAAEDAHQHHDQLLPELEVDAEELGEEQHRHAFEHRRAVLVGGGADGQDEARDPARQLQLLSATRSAVGRVALDEAVEKAITLASCVSRKKAIGLLPAQLEQAGNTPNIWMRERKQHHADVGRRAGRAGPSRTAPTG